MTTGCVVIEVEATFPALDAERFDEPTLDVWCHLRHPGTGRAF